MRGTLDLTIEATQEVLRQRLAAAVASHAGSTSARARCDHPETDAFLFSTSRHLAGVSVALLPEIRHRLPEGAARAREFVQQVRRLELALAQVKAKLYGEAHAIHRGWAALWSDVRLELEHTLLLERRLVDELLVVLGTEHADALAARVCHAELHAPTRPHPWLPHQGVRARLARRIVGTVDQFWDTAEGRAVPAPVAPRPPHHNGLLAHYVLADTDPDPE